MEEKETLNLNYFRRFGVEIELNAFDMRSRPLDNSLPEGIYYVGNVIQKTTNDKVLIQKWMNNHNNNSWIVKPDASCGIEVCTPVLKGWNGVLKTCRVIDAFSLDSKITSDSRCSFHVHIDVEDLTDTEIASIISWWIKCESVFLDSVPASRKKNQYCQPIGQSDMFEEQVVSVDYLLKKVGYCKYYTINTFHYQRKRRKTIEFRIMDYECCLNSWMTKNWIRLIIHFAERAILKGLPGSYRVGDRWSGYCWLDPIDVFEFLGFSDKNQLSLGLEQVKSWFISRLKSECKNTVLNGVMSEKARKISINQIEQFNDKKILILDEDIYGDKFRV